MLDRATACLKSGAARDSRQCIQQISRSKRMLHSTFWNHGAGDLGLPPWALPAPLSSDSTSRASRRSQKSVQNDALRHADSSSDGNSEGVFLDFLYPPQALAWLQRVGGHPYQRWEKRNARRLPEGFVVASRAYSSRSQWSDIFPPAPESGDKRNLNQTPQQSQNAQFETGEEMEMSRPHVEELEKESELQDDTGQASAEELEKALDAEDDQREFASYSPYSNSPTELAEQEHALEHGQSYGSSTSAPDDVQQLRHVMTFGRTGRAKNRLELMQRAIEIYDSLDKDIKGDVRLKREFLEWLSLQDDKTAQLRCVETYHSIPTADRTLQTYQAALSVLLARRHNGSILKLHQTALQNIENGYQISRTLFDYYLEKKTWAMAIQVEKEHYEHYSGTAQASQISVFWLHVSETPQLLSKAISLLRFLGTKKGSKYMDDHVRKFCGRFFKEAITQEFLLDDSPSSFKGMSADKILPPRAMRRLLAHISQVEGDGSKLFEETLLAMLHPNSGFRYTQLHHLASSMYEMYRKMATFRPNEALFMRWLERLTEYADTLLPPEKTPFSMSLATLVTEWEEHFTKVSRDGVKRLLAFYARLGELEPYEKWLDYHRSAYPNYEDERDILWTMIWIHAKRDDLDQAQQAFAEVTRITGEHGEQPDIQCWNLLLLAHSRADDLEGALINFRNLMDIGKLKPDRYSIQNVLQLFAKRGDVEGVENMLRQYDVLSDEERGTAHLGSLLIAHVNNDNVQTAEAILRDHIPRVRRKVIYGSLTGCYNIIMTSHAMRRDLRAVTRTYRWMKSEGVSLDGGSYAAILQALVNMRRTQGAYGVMKRVMPRNHIQPTAFHYAILIAGFVNNRQPEKAIEIYEEMVRKRIRPTASVNVAYLKARAIVEHSQKRSATQSDEEFVPLEETVEALRKFLKGDTGAMVPSIHPFHGLHESALDVSSAVPAAYFDFLIQIHGQLRCFQAVHELNRQYREEVEKRGRSDEAPPIKLLSALAAVHFRERKHDEVEECWLLAKEQADRFTALTAVPDFKSPPLRDDIDDLNALALEPSANEETTKRDDGSSDNGTDPSKILVESTTRTRRAPARRHVLSRILRHYLLSLHAQSRTLDAIGAVVEVLANGYTMDNPTWNLFVRTLCWKSPPLTLLAFVLTERFLTPNFPGWSGSTTFPPKREAVAVGLQYIKARYLAPGQLMPRYDTLVALGGALLAMRKSQALGRGDVERNLPPELQQYVGTFGQVQRMAPNTLSIVQNMPKVPDRLQSRVLKNEGV